MKENKYQKSFVENVIKSKFNDKEILDLMIPIGKISPEKVMQIYAEDYQFRMLESMQSNFESIWMILGDDLFKEIIFKYIIENPSNTYDLNRFGDSFPLFLKQCNIYEEIIPMIEDLAKFELAYWALFHAPINKVQNNLIQINEKLLNSQLNFEQGILLFSSPYKVFEIFKNRKEKSDLFLQDRKLEDFKEESHYLLYKIGLQVNCFQLTTAQFKFFQELEKKFSIIDVINLGHDITQEEMLEMFKFISSSLLTFLKEK